MQDRIEYLSYFGLGIMQDMRIGNIMPTAYEGIMNEIRDSLIEIIIFNVQNGEPEPSYYCNKVETESIKTILIDCLDTYNIRIPRLEDHTKGFILAFQDKDHYGLSPLSDDEFLRLENVLPRNELRDSV